MAKYETTVRGSFGNIVSTFHDEILSGSASASFEDGAAYTVNGVKFETRIYERYSWTGSNRLSLTLNFTGYENVVRITAFTSGGSQGMFFKVNTFGEEAFLDKVRDIAEKMERGSY